VEFGKNLSGADPDPEKTGDWVAISVSVNLDFFRRI